MLGKIRKVLDKMLLKITKSQKTSLLALTGIVISFNRFI